MSGRWGGRPDPYAPVPARVIAADADTKGNTSIGVDLRYDAVDAKPWCVVEWPEGKESRFVSKEEAYDHIKSLGEKDFWDEGDGAARDRDREK